jgi:hypothetical protein
MSAISQIQRVLALIFDILSLGGTRIILGAWHRSADALVGFVGVARAAAHISEMHCIVKFCVNSI